MDAIFHMHDEVLPVLTDVTLVRTVYFLNLNNERHRTIVYIYFCLCIIALLVYFCIFFVCFRIIYSLRSFGSLCAIFSSISYFLVLVAFFVFSLAPILSVKSYYILL
jgi:glucan phosphoethanolaminetransferase (alkaline phosphatase superfamily)